MIVHQWKGAACVDSLLFEHFKGKKGKTYKGTNIDVSLRKYK